MSFTVSYYDRWMEKRMEKRKKVKKLLTSIASLLLIFLLSTFLVSWVRESPQRNAERIQADLAKYEHITVWVDKGDTAWGLQKELTPNADIRYMLFLAKTLNGDKNLGKLWVGDTIILLKEK